jgi:hypothetical protein
MKVVHICLLAAIAGMVAMIIYQRRSKEFMEAFTNIEEPKIVINAEHCGFMVKQMASYQADLDAGRGSVANISMMMDFLKDKMASTGCSGNEVEVGPLPIIITPPVPTNTPTKDATASSEATSAAASSAAASSAAASSEAASSAATSAAISAAISAASSTKQNAESTAAINAAIKGAVTSA